MKKIVFCCLSMKSRTELSPQNYSNTGNAECGYNKAVIYPINAILAEKLHKGDEVKVVLIKSNPIDNNKKDSSNENINIYKEELNGINANIGAKIDYEVIESDFKETKENHETRYREMLAQIEQNCELFVDMTYGPRLIPMILMCVLNFAEKFFNADIRSIIYGKVEFVNGKAINPELYDVTSLYYLNNLTNVMTADSGEDALEALDEFFAL
ncbi:MAG: hypothetical protein IKQ61_07410 [Spirochaetales bacterium]|nr:hypothetical protein [Spirochaetales bacterium]